MGYWDRILKYMDGGPEVCRVCFKPEGLEASDGIYVFTTLRPESFVIPAEASGGAALWNEIVKRGLFSADLAVTAASAVDGIFCWPPLERTKETE